MSSIKKENWTINFFIKEFKIDLYILKMIPQWQIVPQTIIEQLPKESKYYEPFRWFEPMDTRIIILGNHNDVGEHNVVYSTYNATPALFHIYYILHMKFKDFVYGDGGSLFQWMKRGVLLYNINFAGTDDKWYGFSSTFLNRLMDINDKCIIFNWGHMQWTKTYIDKKHNNRIYNAMHPSTEEWTFNGFDHIQNFDWNVVPSIKIYTDGACSKNGKSDSTSGWSVVFKDYFVDYTYSKLRDNTYSLNNGKLVHNPNNIIKGTNMRAELYATIVGLWIISQRYKKAKVEIVTDNKYVILCYESCNNWIKTGDKANMDLVQLAYTYNQMHVIRCTHQFGHVENPTTENEWGNYYADKYALMGKELSNHNWIVVQNSKYIL